MELKREDGGGEGSMIGNKSNALNEKEKHEEKDDQKEEGEASKTPMIEKSDKGKEKESAKK